MRRLPREWKWVLGFFGLLLGIHWMLLVLSARALRAERRRWIEEGRPVTLEQVIPPAVPETENGAVLYSEAFQVLQTPSDGPDSEPLDKVIPEITRSYTADPKSPDFQARLEQLLGRPDLQTALDKLTEAADRPACRFEMDYRAGPTMLMPHLTSFLKMARLLQAKAICETRRGETNNALFTLTVILKMAESLRSEPALISQLVRNAVALQALSGLRKVMNDTVLPAEAAAAMRPWMRKLDDRSPFVRSLEAEQVVMNDWLGRHVNRPEFFEPEMGQGDLSRWKGYLAVAAYTPMRQWDQAAYARLMRRAASAMAVPWHLGRGPDLDREVEGLPPWFILSRLLMPAVRPIREKMECLLAETRMAGLALALNEFRRREGRYPDLLDGVAPADEMTDPFSGEPLRYRREGEGFVLWSVGPQGDQQEPPPSFSPEDGEPQAWPGSALRRTN